ncbi:splicing factor 1 protein [Dioscorea alata]|uniref:Splicing factor 1 protein n=1 Tax=Dioscorea alata TaxID=55571 RepID=A0ACB7TZ61_DIOAL|nr:splicing factor 1 protein [Dioscorea alata]
MAAKIDQASSAEPSHALSIGPSATAAASSPRVSMFVAKSGFVIPKNKLSGSLVPIYKSGGKADAGDTSKEETAKQVQRKTKWGADLTQDAAVRKGRALAYQTRVEQITKQLKTKSLEGVDDHDSSPNKASEIEPVSQQNHESKKFEQLELEKREIIGELLRLNPSYKAPSDYKPLLKEAKVPIPNKAYLPYDFISLLLGPQSNTQKRLEQETGATIHVCGTKYATGEKHLITQSEIKEAQDSFEDLHVSISADTYEKIDAAVALIELLLTPVSGSLAAASTNPSSSAGNTVDINGPNPIVSTSGYGMMPIGAQGMPQPTPVRMLSPQFQSYPGSWFRPTLLSAQLNPSSGFVAPPIATTSISFPASSDNPFNLSTPFQCPPIGPVPRTPSTLSGPQIAAQIMQQPPNLSVPPQGQPMLGKQPPQPAYSTLTQPAFPATQPMPISIPSSWSSVAVNSQSRPITPSGPPPNMPLTAPSPALPTMPRPHQPVYPSAITSLPSQVNLVNHMASVVASRPPTVNFPPPATIPSRSSVAPPFSSITPLQHTSSTAQATMLSPSIPAPVPPHVSPLIGAPAYNSSQMRPPSQSFASQTPLPSVLNPVLVPGQASRPTQPPLPSLQSSTLGPVSDSSKPPMAINSILPSVVTPQRHPSSIDFTFQPLQGQVSASPNIHLPNVQSVAQNPNALPPAGPRAPLLRPSMHNMAPSVGTQGFGRPFAVNQAVPPTFGPTVSPQLSLPSMAPAARMTPPSFSPAPLAPNLHNPLLTRPLNLLNPHPHQNQPLPLNRPSNLQTPNHQLGNNQLGHAFGKPFPRTPGSQFYDPFSPTSVSSAPQQLANDLTKEKKPETDAEYEDLMASVGVR